MNKTVSIPKLIPLAKANTKLSTSWLSKKSLFDFFLFFQQNKYINKILFRFLSYNLNLKVQFYVAIRNRRLRPVNSKILLNYLQIEV